MILEISTSRWSAQLRFRVSWICFHALLFASCDHVQHETKPNEQTEQTGFNMNSVNVPRKCNWLCFLCGVTHCVGSLMLRFMSSNLKKKTPAVTVFSQKKHVFLQLSRSQALYVIEETGGCKLALSKNRETNESIKANSTIQRRGKATAVDAACALLHFQAR